MAQTFDWQGETDLSYSLFIERGGGEGQFLTHKVPVIERTLFYDISDLIIFIGTHGFISPIQQGQLDLLAAALAQRRTTADFAAVEFCYSEFNRPWRLPPDLLAELVAYARSGQVDVDAARLIVDRLKLGGRAFLPGAGSVYFAPGAFWAGCVALGLCAAVQQNGARFGVMIHDLSSLAPEGAAGAAALSPFEQLLRQGIGEWDFFSAASPPIAEALEAYARRVSPQRPIVILPLPLPHGHARTAADIAWEARADLSHQAFVDGGMEDGAFERSAVPVVENTLFYDLSDLMIFLWTHGFVSGIQRVQLELLAASLGPDAASGRFDGVEFAVSEFDRPWRLPVNRLRDLVLYAQCGHVDLTLARLAVDRLRAEGRAFLPGKGSVYFAPGAFWAGCVAEGLSDTVQRNGAAFGVMVHDLFPITLPDMAEENTARTFEGLLRRGVARWDLFTTNSRYTARELEAYLKRVAPERPIPVLPVPLAHANATPEDIADPPAGLTSQSFILCVGTIEPRKNHARLIEAWRAMKARNATGPKLVLVGRAGWRSEPLVEALRAAGEADEGIVWLESVSDAELAALYRDCLFTVYPSLAEGWGLPVGESLAAGKVCITTRRTSLPEVGGHFAVYVDPTRVKALTRALERLVRNPWRRIWRERWIAHRFRPRTWKDFSADMLAALSDPRRASKPGLWRWLGAK